jgi:hypothetical protein
MQSSLVRAFPHSQQALTDDTSDDVDLGSSLGSSALVFSLICGSTCFVVGAGFTWTTTVGASAAIWNQKKKMDMYNWNMMQIYGQEDTFKIYIQYNKTDMNKLEYIMEMAMRKTNAQCKMNNWGITPRCATKSVASRYAATTVVATTVAVFVREAASTNNKLLAMFNSWINSDNEDSVADWSVALTWYKTA